MFVKTGASDPGSFFHLQDHIAAVHTDSSFTSLFNNHFANFVKQLLFCALIINLSSFSKLDFAADKSQVQDFLFTTSYCFQIQVSWVWKVI